MRAGLETNEGNGIRRHEMDFEAQSYERVE